MAIFILICPCPADPVRSVYVAASLVDGICSIAHADRWNPFNR